MFENFRIKALKNAFSLLMFFFTFGYNFLLLNSDLLSTFYRGAITYIVSYFFISVILIFWRFLFRDEEWKMMFDKASDALTEE